MKASEFKGKEVILFYKVNEETDVENPTAKIIDEVEGFGLYVELEGGEKEVVSFAELKGWREINQYEKDGD
ncbi:hypothetical protein CVD28_03810 [Bacillus sp. M6-12]|uniref:hypothetical protein n=1 Tax=Bacillus sp. M6-12 TaxID=2054166 RepID=UPI000C764F22|nr:hypothetical protein [Bacillus sp. M6-12]PLS19553.1 hypothetical protein CVD28_03810 [Bacillus sp. M6-12]